MFEKAVGHFRSFLTPGSSAQSVANDADSIVVQGAFRELQFVQGADLKEKYSYIPPSRAPDASNSGAPAAQKYLKMKEQGYSTQRIRGQMVRDGVLQARQLPLRGTDPSVYE